jgi:uncharacterized membrane protein YgcG
MRHLYTTITRHAALTVAALLGALTGCCQDKCGPANVDRCADIPAGAIPQPNGTYACQWQTAQMERADQDHFVVYEHEWRAGGDALGPFGQRHVEELAARLPAVPNQLTIEPHFDVDRNAMDGELNEARRAAVVAALTAHGVEGAADRVVIGWPRGEGLYGDEAARIGQKRLQGGQGVGGASSGALGGGSSGSFGGSSFGGGSY